MSFITNRSVLLNSPNCVSDIHYNELIKLRSMKSRDGGVPTEVRDTGANVDIPDNATYEAYKMRRKVEVLEYNYLDGGQNCKKILFARMSNLKKSPELSDYAIKNRIACEKESKLLPPTYSGIRDPSYPGYQLNPLIRFRLFL